MEIHSKIIKPNFSLTQLTDDYLDLQHVKYNLIKPNYY